MSNPGGLEVTSDARAAYGPVHILDGPCPRHYMDKAVQDPPHGVHWRRNALAPGAPPAVQHDGFAMHRKVRFILHCVCAFAVLLMLSGTPQAGAFSFSEAERQAEQENARKAQQVVELLSTECRRSLRESKVCVMIGERTGGSLRTYHGSQGLLVDELNAKLGQLGLRTFSAAQIRNQIAQAEARAILNNDPDAALAASSRLGARFFIKGVISSRANHAMSVNVKGAQMQVNAVTVDITLALTDNRGRTLSSVASRAESWAGADTVSVALDLLRDEASLLVARLYHDFCARAGG